MDCAADLRGPQSAQEMCQLHELQHVSLVFATTDNPGSASVVGCAILEIGQHGDRSCIEIGAVLEVAPDNCCCRPKLAYSGELAMIFEAKGPGDADIEGFLVRLRVNLNAHGSIHLGI